MRFFPCLSMDPNTPFEVGQLSSSTLHRALTRWRLGELHCQNVCRLSKQVLMNMTVCAVGSLSLSVNMQPCSSDSCLPRWVAITWGFRTPLILIGRAGHRAHTSLWGFQPPSFSWCTICVSWPQPRGHAEWCLGPRGVFPQKTECAF